MFHVASSWFPWRTVQCFPAMLCRQRFPIPFMSPVRRVELERRAECRLLMGSFLPETPGEYEKSN